MLKSAYQRARKGSLRDAFVNDQAAIDLASIMVGIIVIGIIGGVIGATVFAVVPWAQDNAAKANLEAVKQAQSVFAGFEADKAAGLGSPSNLAFIDPFNTLTTPTTTVAAGGTAVYAQSVAQLRDAGLLSAGESKAVKVAAGDGNTCYAAAAASGSGNVFWYDSANNKVQKYAFPTSTASCANVALDTLVPEEAKQAEEIASAVKIPVTGFYSAMGTSTNNQYVWLTDEYGAKSAYSEDFGKTWKTVSRSNVFSGSVITLHVSDNGKVLYYTTNKGAVVRYLSDDKLTSTSIKYVGDSSVAYLGDMNPDGSKVAAIPLSGTTGKLVVTNTNDNLVGQTTDYMAARDFYMNSDGSKMVYSGINGQNALKVSADGGKTFRDAYKTNGSSIYASSGLAMSQDGSKIAALSAGSEYSYSTDFGSTWTTTKIPTANYKSLAVSNDGKKVMVGLTNGTVMYSTDSGTTWKNVSVGTGAVSQVTLAGDGSSFYTAGFNSFYQGTFSYVAK